MPPEWIHTIESGFRGISSLSSRKCFNKFSLAFAAAPNVKFDLKISNES